MTRAICFATDSESWFFFQLQKASDVSQMEMKALKVAEELNAEYWSVSAKSGAYICYYYTNKACSQGTV